jgi:hypothetical protein
VHDDVHEDFLERELERQRFGRRQVGSGPEFLQEPRQDRQLRRLARYGRAPRVHAG